MEKSSEHVVYYGYMCNYSLNNNITPIVLKFHKRFKNKLYRYTKNHMISQLINYKYLYDFLQLNPIVNVQINDIYIIYNEVYGHLWIENFISNFDKFWASGGNKLYSIVHTNKKELFLLQESMYRINKLKNNNRIIMDLQGGFNNNMIVLTDIEYSDTLPKLGWNERNLITCFENNLNTLMEKWKLNIKFNLNDSIKVTHNGNIVLSFKLVEYNFLVYNTHKNRNFIIDSLGIGIDEINGKIILNLHNYEYYLNELKIKIIEYSKEIHSFINKFVEGKSRDLTIEIIVFLLFRSNDEGLLIRK